MVGLSGIRSDPLTMDNHAYREEMLQAVKSGRGSTIRRSDTLEQDMLYVALPVKAGENFDGFVRLSVSLKEVDQGSQTRLDRDGDRSAGAVPACALVSYRVAKGLTSPLEKITRVARRISRLEYDARVKIHRKDEIGQWRKPLTEWLTACKPNCERSGIMKICAKRSKQYDRWYCHGERGRPDHSCESVAERMLGINAEVITGKSYRELKRHYELTKLMEEGLESKEDFHEERNIYYPVESIIRLDGVAMMQEEEQESIAGCCSARM